ncbi:PAS domain-containing sensor histidine kinase [Acidimicrobiia bacterium EGI L10123]|uniref:PAS domain-containing sensor histidine kinase n=1 Tax=Salinilacustrithrix flava TaxID=2957203 RepID=UPI003D7C3501|nr:PAS domain-containing sensor histidine kinase [Acidimicrobiia bacterium EGI L10123]
MTSRVQNPAQAEVERPRQRLERITTYLSSIVDNLVDGVLLVDDVSFRISVVNDAFLRLVDSPATPTELVGRNIDDLRSPIRGRVEDPEAFSTRIDALYEGDLPATDLVRFVDGRVLERDYVPVPVGPTRRAHLWLFRDVTEREQTEELRRRMLERESAARTAAEETSASLRELARLKTELVASVSHELRTPLTSLRTFVELLAADAPQLSEEHCGFVDAIDRNTDRLLTLVEDLLLLAQLESQALSFRPVLHDVASLVRTSVESIAPLAQAAGVTIDLEPGSCPVALLDPVRIDQLLTNLLSNALKFTPAGGHVQVTTHASEDGCRLEIADTGLGIPATETDRVLDRFYRASNAGATPGTGLGLSISAAIVEMHGGSMEIRRGDPGGTVVVVHLPASGQLGG